MMMYEENIKHEGRYAWLGVEVFLSSRDMPTIPIPSKYRGDVWEYCIDHATTAELIKELLTNTNTNDINRLREEVLRRSNEEMDN